MVSAISNEKKEILDVSFKHISQLTSLRIKMNREIPINLISHENKNFNTLLFRNELMSAITKYKNQFK
tara:strand:+ start:327 stop:530 length:204 start_codon:yes stop_codon:yes gene_type:complete